MGWIDNNWARKGLEIKPYQTDMDTFRIVKSRHPQTCCDCKAKIPKGSYLYGSGWNRLCLICGYAFSKTAVKEFDRVIEEIKAHQKSYEINKEEWTNNNMLANL